MDNWPWYIGDMRVYCGLSVPKAKFYLVVTPKENYIYIHYRDSWYRDTANSSGLWYGVNLYKVDEKWPDNLTDRESRYAPIIRKLQRVLERSSDYGFTDHWINYCVHEMEYYRGKDRGDVGKSENDDGHGHRREHDNVYLFYIDEIPI